MGGTLSELLPALAGAGVGAEREVRKDMDGGVGGEGSASACTSGCVADAKAESTPQMAPPLTEHDKPSPSSGHTFSPGGHTTLTRRRTVLARLPAVSRALYSMMYGALGAVGARVLTPATPVTTSRVLMSMTTVGLAVCTSNTLAPESTYTAPSCTLLSMPASPEAVVNSTPVPSRVMVGGVVSGMMAGGRDAAWLLPEVVSLASAMAAGLHILLKEQEKGPEALQQARDQKSKAMTIKLL